VETGYAEALQAYSSSNYPLDQGHSVGQGGGAGMEQIEGLAKQGDVILAGKRLLPPSACSM
jgi:hypothetical protein